MHSWYGRAGSNKTVTPMDAVLTMTVFAPEHDASEPVSLWPPQPLRSRSEQH